MKKSIFHLQVFFRHGSKENSACWLCFRVYSSLFLATRAHGQNESTLGIINVRKNVTCWIFVSCNVVACLVYRIKIFLFKATVEKMIELTCQFPVLCSNKNKTIWLSWWYTLSKSQQTPHIVLLVYINVNRKMKLNCSDQWGLKTYVAKGIVLSIFNLLFATNTFLKKVSHSMVQYFF